MTTPYKINDANMTGFPAFATPPPLLPGVVPPQPTHVSVRGLTLAFAGNPALHAKRHASADAGSQPGLHDLQLDFAAGQVHVLLGPNGCGKSTLLRAIARLQPYRSGEIVFTQGARSMAQPRCSARELARILAWMPQESQAPHDITVRELVRCARYPHQLWHGRWRAEDEAALQMALAACDLQAYSERPLGALSGGQRQRAQLALVLAQQSPVLLLDEPCSMLDPGHQLDLLLRLRSLAALGHTVIVVLHDINAALRHADQLIALKDGRVLAAGAPQQVASPALLAALYGIEAEVLEHRGAPLVAPLRPLLAARTGAGARLRPLLAIHFIAAFFLNPVSL